MTRLVPSVLDEEANRKPVNLEHVVDVNILRKVGTVYVQSNFGIDRTLGMMLRNVTSNITCVL